MGKVRRTGIMITECPNCSAIWGIGSEEWEWQQCDACGWPDNNEDFDDTDFNDGID